jgi:serine/threonine protein kinase
MQRS